MLVLCYGFYWNMFFNAAFYQISATHGFSAVGILEPDRCISNGFLNMGFLSLSCVGPLDNRGSFVDGRSIMATVSAKRFSVKTDGSVFKRLGCGSQNNIARNQVREVFNRLGCENQQNIARTYPVQPAVCKYWLQGRCLRNPCRFLHPDLPKPDTNKSKHSWKNPNTFKSRNSPPVEKPQQKVMKNNENREHCQIASKTLKKVLTSNINVNVSQSKSSDKTKDCTKVENNEGNITGQSKVIGKTVNCTNGENLQSWFCGSGLSMLAQLEGHTKAPGLAVVIVGHRKDSRSYVNMKRKAYAEVGIKSIDIDLPEQVPDAELIAKVHALNADSEVHGILVQLPVPKHINEEKVGKLAMKGRDPLFLGLSVH
ncbi:zinc finger CCCH domain-containing protein 48-like protein isoform X2 [Tanacetum coccineum]